MTPLIHLLCLIVAISMTAFIVVAAVLFASALILGAAEAVKRRWSR
jgi:ABC-type multidrug transport system permease subunit